MREARTEPTNPYTTLTRLFKRLSVIYSGSQITIKHENLVKLSDPRRYGSAKTKIIDLRVSFELEKCLVKPHCSKTQIPLVAEPGSGRRHGPADEGGLEFPCP